MKLAVLTCGMLPIPAVQGGAVENLIDFSPVRTKEFGDLFRFDAFAPADYRTDFSFQVH